MCVTLVLWILVERTLKSTPTSSEITNYQPSDGEATGIPMKDNQAQAEPIAFVELGDTRVAMYTVRILLFKTFNLLLMLHTDSVLFYRIFWNW